MKTLKKYGWLLLIPIAIGAVIGYRMYHKPHFDMTRANVDYTTDAVSLFDAYDSDMAAADAKYLGKIVQVSGELHEIDIEAGKQPVIHLRTDHIFGLVSCELDPHSTHQLKEMEPGDPVVVKGVVTGFLSDVVMNRCIVIH